MLIVCLHVHARVFVCCHFFPSLRTFNCMSYCSVRNIGSKGRAADDKLDGAKRVSAGKLVKMSSHTVSEQPRLSCVWYCDDSVCIVQQYVT